MDLFIPIMALGLMIHEDRASWEAVKHYPDKEVCRVNYNSARCYRVDVEWQLSQGQYMGFCHKQRLETMIDEARAMEELWLNILRLSSLLNREERDEYEAQVKAVVSEDDFRRGQWPGPFLLHHFPVHPRSK